MTAPPVASLPGVLCFAQVVPGSRSRPFGPPGGYAGLDRRAGLRRRGLDGQGELRAGQAGGGVPRHPLGAGGGWGPRGRLDSELWARIRRGEVDPDGYRITGPPD